MDAAAKGPGRPFWERKTLARMTPEEWEALCDGCGRCCLHRLTVRFEGGGEEVVDTDVACRLLDIDACRCANYRERHRRVHDCLALTPETVAAADWLPETCAYRLIHLGQPLAWWHPLVSGSPDTVHDAGISVRGKCRAEESIADLGDYFNRFVESHYNEES